MSETMEAKHGRRHYSDEKFAPNNPGLVLNLLKQGKVDLQTASRMFERTQRDGIVLAGETALELAMNAEGSRAADDQFLRASKLFKYAQQRFGAGDDGSVVPWAKANVLGAFVPALAYIKSAGELPPGNGPLVSKIYRALIDSERWCSALFANKPPAERHLIKGTASELAVMTLFVRSIMMRESSDQPFFAALAPFSEHYKGIRSGTSYGWDVGLYTHTGTGAPQLTRKVQVQSSPSAPATRLSSASGIYTVCVDPNLSLHTAESHIGFKIFREAQEEANASDAQSSQNLDRRTRGLFAVIDFP